MKDWKRFQENRKREAREKGYEEAWHSAEADVSELIADLAAANKEIERLREFAKRIADDDSIWYRFPNVPIVRVVAYTKEDAFGYAGQANDLQSKARAALDTKEQS